MFDKTRMQHVFFFALIGVALVLSFFVLRPYILTLVLAVVLALAVDPAYIFIRNLLKGRRRLAALITLILVLIVIIAPISFFTYQIFLEAQDIYTSLADGTWTPSSVRAQLDQSTGIVHTAWVSISQQLDSIAQNVLNFFVTRIGTIFASVASVVLNLFLLFFGIYFILSNREKLHAFVKHISPLEDEYDDMIIHKIKTASNSVVRGMLAIAIIQGIVASVGFSIFGIPSPMIWGGLAALAAFVPGIGTTLVTGPAVIYLFATGDTGNAIGMLIWAAVAVGLIDNLLTPLLLDRGIQIHPFLILLSVLGGISLFSGIGFILGPVIIAFLVALLDAHAAFSKKDKASLPSS